jgi:hypothetical protein
MLNQAADEQDPFGTSKIQTVSRFGLATAVGHVPQSPVPLVVSGDGRGVREDCLLQEARDHPGDGG